MAAEAAADGGRPYGVSSVHACDDGSRIAVSLRAKVRPVHSYGRVGAGVLACIKVNGRDGRTRC